MSEVTTILSRLDGGDPKAADELLAIVYAELRSLAAARLAHERHDHTLGPTALVHDAYLRLIQPGGTPAWDSRGHFFAAAAEAMRRILVDSARRKRRLKRGGHLEREHVELADFAAPEITSDLLELDAALEKLELQDPRKAQLVKLRYFTGLTVAQAAEALGISPATADRDWSYARAWLFREIRSPS